MNQKKLINWYQKNKRNLPFRKDKNPYKIWISEVMLQQTRVGAMLPSYENFIKKFPTIEILAKSSEKEVLSFWKGLGYYSRAINLRKGAIYLVTNFNGKFPRKLEEILKVPGIGPYTGRAILSIAFDEPVAVLDGNVKRVLSRLFCYEKDIKDSKNNIELQEIADSFLNINFSGDHNQAMMELGATICILNPICLYCPINNSCKAYLSGKVNEFPIRKKEKEKLEIKLIFYFVTKNGKYLLIKDSNKRFFKKIYSPPFSIEGKNLPENYNPINEFYNRLNKLKPDIVTTGKKHSITHHSIELLISKIDWKDILKIQNDSGNLINEKKLLQDLDYKWIDKNDLEEEFPSSIAKKIKSFL
ncbi:MAG: A/G-specific adenine glycosylase [Leptospiraceae bacterium]|nr:A/G-specific adenine glycosylase [Leptospiraceae bacterium]